MTVGPPVTFIPVPGSRTGRVACSVCGTRGMAGSAPNWQPWQQTHLRGHRPCGFCGRMLVVLLGGGVRVHTRCPGGDHDAPSL